MAISINWATKVIFVPQADLTFISGVLYEHDVNAFRLALKSIEDSEDGMVFLDTHRHNTEVVLSGITYSRFFEIINGYTVEYEDGQYVVNCVGANHNLADVKVANQVSLIIGNSAGLITANFDAQVAALQLKTDEIHGQMMRAVFINTELVPAGNGYQQTPFNNFTSAVDFAEANGLHHLILLADATVDRQLRNFMIDGMGEPNLDLNGQIMTGTHVNNCHVNGTLAGSMSGNHVELTNVTNIAGHYHDVTVSGTLTVQSAADLLIHHVSPALAAQPWTLNMNSGVASVAAVHNISGGLTVTNMDHAGDVCHLGFLQGQVTIDATCTLGTLVIFGRANVINNSAGTNVIRLEDTNVKLTDLWRRKGLDPANPLTLHENGNIEVADIDIDAVTTGTSPNKQTVQTRQ
jgi:hypothetical protein